MKRFVLIVLITLCFSYVNAQTGTDFWLAPPDITDLHNTPGGEPIYLHVVSQGLPSTVTISQPANPGFNGGTPIVINLNAGKSRRINLTAFKASLETRPTNTICNTGIRVQTTNPVTSYYEIANTNNTDITTLYGNKGLGQQFFIPLHKHAPFNNEASYSAPHLAFASFDIVATQNGTVVTIYSPVAVDGHAALQQFSVTLNEGQTYSCGWTGALWSQPSTHPSGASVTSDKPIAVFMKDDSNHNPSGACIDLMMDQVMPVNKLGTDYIAVKGSMNNNADESVVLLATEPSTQVFLDGSATPVITLSAGEYYRVDMDYLAVSANNAVFIHTTAPVYAVHITGFGCEAGMGELPPIECAGSTLLHFDRSDAQAFQIILACKTADISNFTIVGPGTAAINPASFVTVPGTGGNWKAARIQYNTTQFPVDSTFKITNSTGKFMLGVINGGGSSGCRYSYYSSYYNIDTAKAGPDMILCANDTAQLNGTVITSAPSGQWTTSGDGTFLPNSTNLNAKYKPGINDITAGTVTLTLTPTGSCNVLADPMVISITPAPTSNAGADQFVCHSVDTVSLTGGVTLATGGLWSGGAGTYHPGANVLNTHYIPTLAERNAGSVTLNLKTTGNGICNPVNDVMTIYFYPDPTSVITASTTDPVCPGDTITLFTSATGTHQWYRNNVLIPGATGVNYAATVAGSYHTVTIDANGCTNVSSPYNVSFYAAPVSMISAPGGIYFCTGDSLQLIANGGTTYEWNNGSTGSFFYTGQPGNYYAIATDVNNCTDTSNVITLTEFALPVLTSSSNSPVCESDSLILGVGGADQLEWILPMGGTYSGSSFIMADALPVQSGNYIITGTDTNNCSTTISINVTIHPASVAVITAPDGISFCEGDSVQLIASGGDGYEWSTGDTGVYIYASTPGMYTLIATTSGNCADTSAAISIAELTNPGMNVSSNSPVCENESLLLTATGADDYVWSLPGGGTSITNPLSISSASLGDAGNYLVTGTNINGCEDTDTIQVDVSPVPVVNMSATSNTPCLSYGLVMLVGAPSGGNFTGNGVSGSFFDPQLAGTGIHTITYSFTNGFGCTDSSQQNIEVLPCLGTETYENSHINLFPNPASELLNMSWNPEMKIERITIFDMWGKLVLTERLTEQGNHSLNIASFPSGIYVIMAEGKTVRYMKWVKE